MIFLLHFIDIDSPSSCLFRVFQILVITAQLGDIINECDEINIEFIISFILVHCDIGFVGHAAIWWQVSTENYKRL